MNILHLEGGRQTHTQNQNKHTQVVHSINMKAVLNEERPVVAQADKKAGRGPPYMSHGTHTTTRSQPSHDTTTHTHASGIQKACMTRPLRCRNRGKRGSPVPRTELLVRTKGPSRVSQRHQTVIRRRLRSVLPTKQIHTIVQGKRR